MKDFYLAVVVLGDLIQYLLTHLQSCASMLVLQLTLTPRVSILHTYCEKQ